MLVNQHKPLAERGEIIFISYIIEWEWREHSWPAPTKTPFRHEAHPDGTTKAQRPGLHISPNASIDNNNSSNKITFQAQDASCSPNRHMTRACTPNKRKQRMHEVIIGSHKHLAGTTHLVLPKAMTRFGQNHIFIGVYGVYTVILVGKSPYIRSCTVYIGIRFWPTQAMTHLFSPLLRHNASCSPQSNDAPVLPKSQARRILFSPKQWRTCSPHYSGTTHPVLPNATWHEFVLQAPSAAFRKLALPRQVFSARFDQLVSGTFRQIKARPQQLCTDTHKQANVVALLVLIVLTNITYCELRDRLATDS